MLNTIIVGSGIGNLRSIRHELFKLGIDANISSSIYEIYSAKFLILQGVGHFAKGTENIKKHKLYDILNKKFIMYKTPILGICFGIAISKKTKFESYANFIGAAYTSALTLIFINITQYYF